MTRERMLTICLAALLLITPALLRSQTQQPKNTLILNGQSTDVPLIQYHGHPYVGLEALATALSGSISSAGTRFALSVPTGAAGSASYTAQSAAPAPAAQPVAAPAPAPDPGFSRDFLRAGIEAMSSLREWHAALEAAIQNTFLSPGSMAPYRANATTNLRLAQVATHTPSDKSGYDLVNNAFQMMATLSDKYEKKRANLTYIDPNALKDDSLNTQLITCGRSLGAMAASGQFTDDGTCH